MTARLLVVATGLLGLLTVTGPAWAQDADTTAAQSDTTAMEAPTDTTAVQAPADTAAVPAPADTAMGAAAPSDTAQALPDSTRIPLPERSKNAAREAASAWLEHVDTGEFGVSWDSAATHLQNAVPRDEWIDRGEQARSDLQALTSRALANITYRDSIPQLPGGQPVVMLEYETEFEGQKVREALVTTKQDTVWRVAGYRVVPADTTTTEQPD